jgi:hypothetical protein
MPDTEIRLADGTSYSSGPYTYCNATSFAKICVKKTWKT